jgi:hypothetical protein
MFRYSLLFVALCVSPVTMTFAAEPPPSAAPSKDMREKMAAAHDKMAACLRSDRELADCRREMQRTCSDMMGEQGCPMMGMGKQGMMPRQQQ